MMTALSGTRIDRNTAISKKNVSRSTTPMKTGRRLPIRSAKSIPPAVNPPTYALTPVPVTTDGITLSRSVCTSLLVASACGEVDGCRKITAAVPSELGTGPTAEATPGVLLSAFTRLTTVSVALAFEKSTATMNLPFAPTP